MKKITALILMLALVIGIPCVISRPGFGDKNTFLSELRTDASTPLYLYVHDGETIKKTDLEHPEIMAELVDEFASYSAKRAKDWSPKMISLPIYAFGALDKDYNSVAGFWSNGYWVTEDGKAYTLDCDIDSIVDYFPDTLYYGYIEYPVSESPISFTDFPCYSLFAKAIS